MWFAFDHQYRAKPAVQTDHSLLWLLAGQFQLLILISLKVILDSSKNGNWIIPFKKFSRLRVKTVGSEININTSIKLQLIVQLGCYLKLLLSWKLFDQPSYLYLYDMQASLTLCCKWFFLTDIICTRTLRLFFFYFYLF